MATIANLDVNLRAQTQKYENNMKRAGHSTRRFSDTTRGAARGTQSFQSRLSSFSTAGTATIAVIAGMALAVNKLVQGFAQAGDEIDKASQRTQIGAAEFQSLSFAFEQNGGSARELETSMRAVSSQYLELLKGTATATDLFGRLGVSVQDLKGLAPDEQFRLIAKQVGTIVDPLERAAVATKLFGRSGATILPLIKNLDETEQRFKDLGLTIDDGAIASAAKLTDLNNELSRSWRKLSAELSTTFMPAVQGLTMLFRDLNRFLADSAKGAEIFGKKLGFLKDIPKLQKALITENNATGPQARSNIVRRRLKVNDPLAEGGVSFLIDKQINSQKALIDALKEQSNRLAPLPQALQRGTSAQIGFVAQLQRQNQQAKIDAREKRKITIAEKQLKELEQIKKQREEEFKDKKEIAII